VTIEQGILFRDNRAPTFNILISIVTIFLSAFALYQHLKLLIST